MTANDLDTLHARLKAFREAGGYFYYNQACELCLSKAFEKKHPKIVEDLRDFKPMIAQTIENHLAVIFLAKPSDSPPLAAADAAAGHGGLGPRHQYATGDCPRCGQTVYLTTDWLTDTPELRYTSHRLASGRVWCRGSTTFVVSGAGDEDAPQADLFARSADER